MNVPDTLYKYTSPETAKIVLKSGKLRWSSPCQFNDLNELQRMPVFKPSIEEGWDDYLKIIIDIAHDKKSDSLSSYSPGTKVLIQLLRLSGKSKRGSFELLRSEKVPQQKQMEDMLRKHVETINDGSIRIFCLSEEPNNDVMWAHYAGNHTGCMLGFRHIPQLDTPFIAAEPVHYTENSPVVGSSINFLLHGDNHELRRKTRKAIYYTKNINWAYEKEWRCLTIRPAQRDEFYSDFKFYPQELESLTFGPRIKDDDKLEIKDIITSQYPACRLFKAYSKRGMLTREIIEPG